MMFRLLTFTVLLLCSSVPGMAQPPGDSSTLNFTVKRVETNITISPNDSVMWADSTKALTINSEGYDIDRVALKGGYISRKGNRFYCRPDSGEIAVLEVYIKHPSGESRLGYVHPYEVKRIPDPTVYVCGVKADSTIDKKQLLQMGQITASINDYEHLPLQVMEFDMLIYQDNTTDTLHSNSDRFTIEMRRQIHFLQPGQIVSFENLVIRGPGGKIWRLRPIELFINETNKFKTGTHNVEGQ